MQAERTASLPFVRPHVALMPDAHLGKGATVGSVLPTHRAVIPAAVGVDIGCGMIAVRTPWSVDDVRSRGPLAPLRGDIERAVPLSAGRYNKRLTDSAKARVAELEAYAEELGPTVLPSVVSAAPNWRLQLGSLGSGNHFIEVSADELDRVWLFLHSGSRGWATSWRPTTSRSPSSGPAASTWTCPTATSPGSTRAPRSSTGTSPSCAGRSASPCSTARR
jgi:tRNA-splicing ligase RtcB